MHKKLIRNIDEYKNYVFSQLEKWEWDLNICKGYGVIYDGTCWDYNENGEEIDEQGNIVPELTPQTLPLEDHIKQLQFPVVIVEFMAKEWDRMGDYQIVLIDFVSITDFSERVENAIYCTDIKVIR